MTAGDDFSVGGGLRFARFREVLLRDAVLQARLRVISDWSAFVDAAIDAASEHGISLSPDDLDAERRRAALGSPAPMGLDDLRGWMPVRARPRDGELLVEWRWLDDVTFREPFFSDTVRLALERPFSLLFPRETTIDELGGLEPGLEPNGFIFHMSRCGSTLVTQMLAAVPEHLVLSEPPLVNDVLRVPGTDDERVRRLQLAVSALGRPRSGAERAYILKLDAWAIHDLPLIRRAFPETPWLFLSRDPLEVLVSHARQRGMQMLPIVVPPELFGIDPAAAVAVPFEEYGALVLGAISRDALARRDNRALFVDYRELPGAVFDLILDWFGVEPTPDDRARMEAAALRNAKVPAEIFVADATTKAEAATPEQRAAVDRWARPAYEDLRG